MSSTSSSLRENTLALLQNADLRMYCKKLTVALNKREEVRQNAAAESMDRKMVYTKPDVLPIPLLPRPSPRALINYYSAFSPVLLKSYTLRNDDMLPFTRTLVKVHNWAKDGTSRYVNANWIRGRDGTRNIATQAPWYIGVHVYLTLIMEYGVRTAVQLTTWTERHKEKAFQWFPEREEGKAMIHQPEPWGCAPDTPAFEVKLLKFETIDEENGIERRKVAIQPVNKDGTYVADTKPYYLTHILYKGWCDSEPPPNYAVLLKLIKLVDEVNATIDVHDYTADELANLDPTPPLCINCCTGVGRSGIFTVLTSVLHLLGWLPTHQPSALDKNPNIPDAYASPHGEIPKEYAEDILAQEIDWQREQRMAMALGTGFNEAMYKIVLEAIKPVTA